MVLKNGSVGEALKRIGITTQRRLISLPEVWVTEITLHHEARLIAEQLAPGYRINLTVSALVPEDGDECWYLDALPSQVESSVTLALLDFLPHITVDKVTMKRIP